MKGEHEHERWTLSFTPTFRSGISARVSGNHFNGFSSDHKVALGCQSYETVETVKWFARNAVPGLKPGVNER